eukprot:UN4705
MDAMWLPSVLIGCRPRPRRHARRPALVLHTVSYSTDVSHSDGPMFQAKPQYQFNDISKDSSSCIACGAICDNASISHLSGAPIFVHDSDHIYVKSKAPALCNESASGRTSTIPTVAPSVGLQSDFWRCGWRDDEHERSASFMSTFCDEQWVKGISKVRKKAFYKIPAAQRRGWVDVALHPGGVHTHAFGLI